MNRPTRPSESDMISRPRADAMQRQLDAALLDAAELREENARLKSLAVDVLIRLNQMATDSPPATPPVLVLDDSECDQ